MVAEATHNNHMLRVGLTGSIAVGKSFVTSVFAELGCPVIDADKIAREVVEPGSKGLAAVVAAFGNEIVGENNSLDRQRLGEIIFADEEKRKLLNSILHPYIRARQDQQLNDWAKKGTKIAIVDAALMIESGGFRRFDQLVVVHCRPEIQLARLMARDALSHEEAQRKIASQLPQAEKQRFADFLIDTSDGREATRRRTEDVYRDLLRISQDKKSTEEQPIK